jgi:hypothetical protein
LEAINNIFQINKINMDIGKVIDIKDCKRGYILKGVANHEVKYKNEKPVIGHFMIFYDDLGGYDFQGAMITSTDYNGSNVVMKKEHFFEKNDIGDRFPIVFNNSHLVRAKLHKFHLMGEFIYVGLLTPEGIAFMEELIDDLPLATWEKHLQNN